MHTKPKFAFFSNEHCDVGLPSIQREGRRDFRRSLELQVVREYMVPGAFGSGVATLARRVRAGSLNPSGLPSDSPAGIGQHLEVPLAR